MKKLLSSIAAAALLMSTITLGLNNEVSAATTNTLFINEVMADNESVLKDGDGSDGGEYSDWIEIYNSGTTPVDLTGYTLSDGGEPWRFPKGVVPANGYLLVWASDKNKVAADGQLHTNFKIGKSNETITLRDAYGNEVDSITTESIENDQSYGRNSDGSSEFIAFYNGEVTPGEANKFIANNPVLFSHEPLHHNISQNLKFHHFQRTQHV